MATGRPVQPHEPLPDDFNIPDGHSRWIWVPLLPDIADALGLAKGATSPDAAASVWKRVHPVSDSQPVAPSETALSLEGLEELVRRTLRAQMFRGGRCFLPSFAPNSHLWP